MSQPAEILNSFSVSLLAKKLIFAGLE